MILHHTASALESTGYNSSTHSTLIAFGTLLLAFLVSITITYWIFLKVEKDKIKDHDNGDVHVFEKNVRKFRTIALLCTILTIAISVLSVFVSVSWSDKYEDAKLHAEASYNSIVETITEEYNADTVLPMFEKDNPALYDSWLYRAQNPENENISQVTVYFSGVGLFDYQIVIPEPDHEILLKSTNDYQAPNPEQFKNPTASGQS